MGMNEDVTLPPWGYHYSRMHRMHQENRMFFFLNFYLFWLSELNPKVEKPFFPSLKYPDFSKNGPKLYYSRLYLIFSFFCQFFGLYKVTLKREKKVAIFLMYVYTSNLRT